MNKKPENLDTLLLALSHSVQARREFLHITQEELANRCGLHRTYISDIERGGRNLSLKNLDRLAHGLEISISTLIRWTEINQTADCQVNEGDLRDFYHNAPCGFHSLDKEGAIIRMNDTELQWLGYSRNELIGAHATKILTDHGISLFHRNFADLQLGKPIHNRPAELKCKNGAPLPVIVSSAPTLDGSGNFTSTRSVVFDLSKPQELDATVLQQLN